MASGSSLGLNFLTNSSLVLKFLRESGDLHPNKVSFSHSTFIECLLRISQHHRLWECTGTMIARQPCVKHRQNEWNSFLFCWTKIREWEEQGQKRGFYSHSSRPSRDHPSLCYVWLTPVILQNSPHCLQEGFPRALPCIFLANCHISLTLFICLFPRIWVSQGQVSASKITLWSIPSTGPDMY